MEPEQSLASAHAQAEALLADGARVLEAPVRAECADFLADLPELSHTPRLSTLRESTSRAQLLRGRTLLARLWALREQGVVGLEPLERAIVGVIAFHGHASEGRLAEAEIAWVAARRMAAAVLSPFRLWEPAFLERRTYDVASGRSRYDPPDPVLVELKLECPVPGCGRLGHFRLERDPEPQKQVCASCAGVLFVWLLEALGPPIFTPGRRAFPGRTSDGEVVTATVPDDGDGPLVVAAGDLLAILGRRREQWEAVENLATGGRFRARGAGPCFLATTAFGDGAPELRTFRAFRDRTLLRSRPGQAAVMLYYRLGPGLARQIAHRPWTLRALRWMLRLLHRTLVKRGYGRG